MKTRAVSITLAIFYILAISSQVPMALGAPGRGTTLIKTVSCTDLPSGFTGQAVFHSKTRYSFGAPTFECNDNGTTADIRTTSFQDKLIEWSITVRIINASGFIVAENFDSGGKAKGDMTATVTATFDAMSVTGSLEWFR